MLLFRSFCTAWKWHHVFVVHAVALKNVGGTFLRNCGIAAPFNTVQPPKQDERGHRYFDIVHSVQYKDQLFALTRDAVQRRLSERQSSQLPIIRKTAGKKKYHILSDYWLLG